ncbi:MAG: hypothetical protein FWG43_01395 [Clostridiales bacterium]|nr:hypothetical protein [Clostridiales bacterium]
MKKLTKKATVLLVVTLALALSLSFMSTAWADDRNPMEPYETSTAAITKLLQVPIGTDFKGLYFNFKAEKVSVNELDDPKDKDMMPIMGNPPSGVDTYGLVEIKFDATNPGTLDITENGINTYFLESGNLLSEEDFETYGAGVYEYKITESQPDSFANNPPEHVLTYSKAEYRIIYYVESDNTSVHGVKIKYIGVVKIKKEDGTTIPPEEQFKVDPTPGPDSGDDPIKKYSQMTFTNTYVHTNGGTDPKTPGDWTLAVSKTVAGTYGDTNTYFEFSLTLNVPSLLPNVPVLKYKAFVVEKDSASDTYKVVTLPANYSGSISGDGSIEFTNGSELSFKLKNGQYLVFIDTPVGTLYKIKEEGVASYIPNASITIDNKKGNTEVGEKATSLTIPDGANSIYKNEVNVYVGEGSKNSADFINDRGGVTPTGLNVNDVPFIGMVALAAGALIAYVVLKLRRRKIYSN